MSAGGGCVPAIVDGTVTHVRSGRVRHRFTTRYRSALVDVDDLGALAGRRVVGLRPGTHLATEAGTTLRERVESCLERHGRPAPGGTVLGLVTLRSFGVGFDPLTLWYCFAPAGQLAHVVLDVHNTYGQSHPYVVDASEAGGPVRATVDKQFHVSPFLPTRGEYDVWIDAPRAAPSRGERLVARIAFTAPDGDRLVAVVQGRLAPLTRRSLLGAGVGAGTQGVRSTALIHLQALRLWRRGAVFRRPPRWTPRLGHEEARP